MLCNEEYIGVKMGLFGLSGKTLIPMEIAHVDEQQRRIEFAASKDLVKNAPRYNDDDDIDHEFEARNLPRSAALMGATKGRPEAMWRSPRSLAKKPATRRWISRLFLSGCGE